MSEFDQSRPTVSGRGIRVDLLLIADLIEPGSRVLDVGCGDGDLLHFLSRDRNVDARGLELSQSGVNACVSRGLSVVQGDADKDLGDYPVQAFDYVVLSQTLQATHDPRRVLEEMVRIGRHAVVSFQNFGYWRIRWQLLTRGRMPVTPNLPETWYDTTSIHLCTIKDFVLLCHELGLTIERRLALKHHGGVQRFQGTGRWANMFGEQGLFVLSRR